MWYAKITSFMKNTLNLEMTSYLILLFKLIAMIKKKNQYNFSVIKYK